MKKTKRIVLLVISVIWVISSTGCYLMAKGNPIRYFQAKREIQTYIEKHYGKEIVMGELSYTSKTNTFYASVTEADDSRNHSSIVYYPTGEIGDYYQFDIQSRMEEEVSSMIYTFLNTQMQLTQEDITINTLLELPPFQYQLDSSYDPNIPVTIQIELNQEFSSKEDYIATAIPLIQKLQILGIPIENAKLYSYLPEDGNSCYQTELTSFEATEEEMVSHTKIVTIKK
ncbi:DUF3139 domain-containing protein [Clostridium facile]|uniref:DUF3139 domain-containing protein n=1 Tax=Clostridium facile TaxID=2763035 RepID=A0ABR7IN78_9CLOT|nr:DUF3139 domain-containing protein [Clostridium facile]MBC5786583.1 DUF3139 domain-containing protein [Clostridium facile]